MGSIQKGYKLLVLLQMALNFCSDLPDSSSGSP